MILPGTDPPVSVHWARYNTLGRHFVLVEKTFDNISAICHKILGPCFAGEDITDRLSSAAVWPWWRMQRIAAAQHESKFMIVLSGRPATAISISQYWSGCISWLLCITGGRCLQGSILRVGPV